VFYGTGALMENVQFTVHRSGFERMKREGRRNVHAWAIGDLVAQYTNLIPAMQARHNAVTEDWSRVYYDFKFGLFRFKKTDKPLVKSDRFVLALSYQSEFYVKGS
jgi:hypothetical protein